MAYPRVIAEVENPTQADIVAATGWRTQLAFGECLVWVYWGPEDGHGVETDYHRQQFIEEQNHSEFHNFQEWYQDELFCMNECG